MKRSAKITYILLRTLMVVVLILSIVGFVLNEDASVKSEYVFNCVQCILFLLVSFAPVFFKRLEIDIPDAIYMIFIIFCMAHFLCGEILGFFAIIPWWDALLHTFSGMLITLLSFSFINLLNNANGKDFKLNLAFSVIFAFCITVTIGVLWEIIEFSIDNIFLTNMQRAYRSTVEGSRGEPFVGSEALLDTMKDLILDSLGAAIVCIGCSIFVIKKKVPVESLAIIKKINKNDIKDTNLDENLSIMGDETDSSINGGNAV